MCPGLFRRTKAAPRLRRSEVNHSLVTQPFPGQLNEHVFECRPPQMHVAEFDPKIVDPANQFDQRLRRLTGTNRELAPVVAHQRCGLRPTIPGISSGGSG